MNPVLLDQLRKFKTDVTVVITLFEAIFDATFIIILKKGTENNVTTMEFLSYPTMDNIREIPLFTEPEFVIDFKMEDSIQLKLSGITLWKRLRKLVETGVTEVAIDPGQVHGIRLKKEMISGMVAEYSTL